MMDPPIAAGAEYQPLALRAPDTEFHLSLQERAAIAPAFDADALERLLQNVRPDMRREILEHFQMPEPGARSRGALTEFTEPELQPLLEEVWVPMWDDVATELLDESSPYPGRALAKQRREARLGSDEPNAMQD